MASPTTNEPCAFAQSTNSKGTAIRAGQKRRQGERFSSCSLENAASIAYIASTITAKAKPPNISVRITAMRVDPSMRTSVAPATESPKRLVLK